MTQQTAVEWLFSQIPFEWSSSKAAFEALQQAKEMEKEQIIDAFNQGENHSVDYFNPENTIKESEQYYNETFNK